MENYILAFITNHKTKIEFSFIEKYNN